MAVPLIALTMMSGCGYEEATEEEVMNGQIYAECIRKTLGPSLALIERMQNQGLDINKPRLVTHLLVGSDESVRNASIEALANGFKVTEQANGRLVISETVPLLEEWLMHTLPVMCSFGEQYRLTYDGWDVDVSDEGLKRE